MQCKTRKMLINIFVLFSSKYAKTKLLNIKIKDRLLDTQIDVAYANYTSFNPEFGLFFVLLYWKMVFPCKINKKCEQM